MSNTSRILVGMDIGKATISYATGEMTKKGVLKNIRSGSERHLGKPVELFMKHYRELDHDSILGIAATGIYSNLLTEPVITGIPEEIAQEYATSNLFPDTEPINIFRLGARGYSILTKNDKGRINYEENDKCSAGTGETIEKICGRMGISLERAIELVGKASDSIPVTARCSVFAKTEMTHFANQGEPHDQLLSGYFQSVARNIFSLYDKSKVDGPVVLIGNGALIAPISESFIDMAKTPVEVSDKAGVYEALGALYYAAERSWNETLHWPSDPRSLIKIKEKRIRSLKPAAGSVVKLEDHETQAEAGSSAVLGIDLGSTGSKAVLIDASSNAVIADIYRRTDGNPVEAAKALVAEFIEMTDQSVIAIGITGSGRDAAATVFRAAYPELESRIFVQNEIVAHATAAIKYDPDQGKSLSIVEIGGQDAKFINVQGGRILESDMNRACSAGTGSFLEEQAIFYDMDDITRFGEIAASSKNPPDLGQMCTVFVADLAAEAVSEGFTVSDVFAGFQYSVIINYKNRVMGNRKFMDRIFFQGKPATNTSLARTLATVTGREVYVPPNPGAMGAIGIAMLAGESIKELDCDSFDLGQLVGARVSERRTFRCKDSKCSNLCRIESATIEVSNTIRKVVSGGSCPKYETVFAGSKKLPKDAPNPYRERSELLGSLLDEDGSRKGGPVVGIPHGHYLIDYLVFFHTFFSGLGAEVEVVRSGPDTVTLGNRRSSANNTCTPAKIMHGLVRDEVDYMFMPKFVDIPPLVKNSGVSTCPMVQALPEMAEKALEAEGIKTKIIRPIFRLGEKGFKSAKFIAQLRKIWTELVTDHKSLKRGPLAFLRTYREALARQNRFEQGLWDIGRRSLSFAREHGYPVVLVMGSSHVIHEPIMNANIQDLIMRNGAIALPLDCFPIPDSIPPLQRVYWGTSSRIMRASIAAAADGSIFPLLMISYGCGPSSFVEQLFNDLLEDYPHTVLESDGHGGQAGYVTRIQAFLYSARSYVKTDKDAIAPEKISRYDDFPMADIEQLRSSKIVVFAVGPNLGEHTAAMLCSDGFDADSSGVTEPLGFHMARESCSGKECLPYQLIWGSFLKYLDDHPPEDGKKTLLLNVTGFGPCRNGMFTLANEIALDKMENGDKVKVITFSSINNQSSALGGVWFSTVATDLLNQMRSHFRPVEKNPGESDRLFVEYSDRIRDVLKRASVGRRLKGLKKKIAPIERLLAEAAHSYHAMPTNSTRDEDLRTVFMCGDIFLRIDEWGSDDLTRKLNDHGLRVVHEPFGEIVEFISLHRSKELVEMESGWLKNRIGRFAMDKISQKLTAAVNNVHPWIKWDSIHDVVRASKELLDGTPFSEAVPTIGSALHTWYTRPIDGVVVVSPWGCGAALIAEAQLRRKTEIPLLFVYNDGDPIEEARLSGFAWRLKNRPPRRLPSIQ